jgi:hypothetical protein
MVEFAQDLPNALRAPLALSDVFVFLGDNLSPLSINLPSGTAVLFPGCIAKSGDPILACSGFD